MTDETIIRTELDVEFDSQSLDKLLDDASMEDAREQNPYARKTYPPSGLGYQSGRCHRRWFYEFQKDIPARQDDMTPDQIENMETGKDKHERIQTLFERSGVLLESERELVSEEPPIRGFVDLIVDWQGKTQVGEIKTTTQEAFTLLKASGIPRAYQLIQLLIYMYTLDIDDGFFLYVNNNNNKRIYQPVSMDDYREYTEYLVDWLNKVYANDTLPTRPFNKSQECKTCPFFDYCWNDEEGTDIGIEPMELPYA